MIRVLHINNELDICSGITKFIILLAQYTGDRISHTVMALRGDADGLFESRGIEFHNLGINRLSIMSIVKFAIAVKRICKSNSIDIIHCHHRFCDLICSILKNYYRVRVITTVHSRVTQYKMISYNAELLITVSASLQNHLIDYFGKPRDKVIFLPNYLVEKEMVSSNDAIPETVAEKIAGKRILLFVGRICREKGVDVLLAAFKELRESYVDLMLLLLGKENQDDKILKGIKENEDILLLPVRYPVNKYYKAAEIVVLPSRSDSFPYVMLEAGYFGKPFVGTYTGGMKEVIEDGVNGLLAGPADSEQLISKISFPLSNRKAAIEMGEKLKIKIMRDYCVKECIAGYKNLYERIFNKEFTFETVL